MKTSRAFTAVTAAVALAAAGCGGPKSAPPAKALPLMPGADVLMAAGGPGQPDNASDPTRYRWMILRGPVGLTAPMFLDREVAYLISHGWKRPFTFVDGGSLTISIDSPARDYYFSGGVLDDGMYGPIDPSPNATEAAQAERTKPLVQRARRSHQPLLYVTLANGRHPA